MKKIMFMIVFLLMVSPTAEALTDYTCVNDCTNTGKLYSYCVKECSTSDWDYGPKNIDYTCVNECTDNGYLYTYCTNKCSY